MFREKIVRLLESEGIDRAGELLERPPESVLGDYALPCFTLGNPTAVAKELAGKIEADFLETVEAKGPYVNFFVSPEARAGLLREIGDGYGKQERKNGRVMVEYSQPNTHKAFHVGHLRGTSLGEALSRILRYAGYEVVQANYSGDTGAHIAKWLWYYLTYSPPESGDREQWIADVYVRAVRELAAHPERQEEVDGILRRLENRDPSLMETYEKTREWSIDAFRSIYEELDARFDVWWFESEVEQRGKEISEELVGKGIAKRDDGAVIVDLEDEGIWVLLRKDGTALYSAKDLALAELKFNEYDITRSIYVIGAAQSTHMRQLFATLERMGFPHADKCVHLSFAEVRLPEGKMSSRTGQNILYRDVRQQVGEHARKEIRERHPEWDERRVEETVGLVTVAALKWDMLAIGPTKTIVFDPKRATEFEGETGPYVQYTHARACSILRRAEGIREGDGTRLTEEKEQDLLRLLERFPEAVERAAREYHPSHLANYVMQLCKAFNSFYHDCPVLQTDENLQRDRLALVKASVYVLGTALGLLGIEAPEEM